MALQIAERAVVGHHLEGVVAVLEAPSRPVAPVAPLAYGGGEDRCPAGLRERAHGGEQPLLRGVRVREER